MSLLVRGNRGRGQGVRRRPARVVLVACLCSSLLAGCRGGGPGDRPSVDPAVTIRVGAWLQAEPQLLSATLAALLRADGLVAEVVEFADARDARRALELEDVDVLPGYTGAAWLEVLERPDPPGNPATSFARVREADERRGLTWLRPRFEEGGADTPPANATFAFFVVGPPARDASLQTLSQLATRLAEDPGARLCMDDEFVRRRDGREALFRAYGISAQRQDVAASPEDAVLAVREGECLAGLATTTDGSAWAAGLRPLADDLVVFPAFVLAPVVDQDALEVAGVARALAPFTAQLTSRLLARHNAAVLAGIPVDRAAEDLAEVLRRRAGRLESPRPDAG